MEKIFNMIRKNKIIMGTILILVIIGVVIMCLCLGKEGSNEKQLRNKLEEIGREFYDSYYDSLKNNYKDKEEEFLTFLSTFKDKGMRVDLDNLSRSNNIDLKKFVNSKTNEACDTKKTSIYIYPTGKYGKKDFKIETKLICGFENLEELQDKAEELNIKDYENMSLKELKKAIADVETK